MGRTLLYNVRLCTFDGLIPDAWLLVDGYRIADLGWQMRPPYSEGVKIDGLGRILAPGLIDIHAHGALGYDTMDATPDGLCAIAQYYGAHGVTTFSATTMTAPFEAIQGALENIAYVMSKGTGGAKLLGAHVEGPYLDVEQRGCQDPSQVRCADATEYTRFFGTGVVRLITIAPEYPENEAVIRFALDRGAAVAAGHTRASYRAMQRAVVLGVSQVTHLYNGMDLLHHRQPGAVGAALTLDGLRAQIIADNIHVHPAALNLAVRAKGADGIILVTDAMSGTGMPDGLYNLGGLAVTVKEGVARIQSGPLAGSTLTLERAVANIMAATGLPIWKALQMATASPARALGIAGTKGRISIGMDADLILMDDTAQVSLTMVEGEVTFRDHPAS